MQTFRRLNVTWRQEVGATPIEAQKAAGHASLDMTFLYTQTDEAREREHVARILDRLKPAGGNPARLRTTGKHAVRGRSPMTLRICEVARQWYGRFRPLVVNICFKWWARGDSNARPL